MEIEYPKEVKIDIKRIKCYAIILGIICIIPIILYVCNFGKSKISDDPADWGTFGDYLGGVLNPILAIIGLFITVSLAYLSDKWNKTSILNQERVVRPIGRIVLGNYEDVIEVKVRNSGLGPMIIKSIEVIKSGTSKNNLIDWMPDPPADDIYWTDFVGDIKDFSISPNQDINLIKFQLTKDQDFWQESEFRDTLRLTLKDMTIKIVYKDIYDKEMPTLTRYLDWFSKSNEISKNES